MRRKWVFGSLCGCLAAALLCGGAAQAQFTARDWPLHRGGPTREGANQGGNIGGALSQLYLWPSTRDVPAEIVVDNLPPAGQTYPLSTGQTFTTAGTWTASTDGTVTEASSGAWPPSGTTSGAYTFASAVTSNVLKTIGTTTLAELPNLSVDGTGPATYAQINTELTNSTTYARWTFGTLYPAGTKQGTRDVAYTATGTGNTGDFRQPLQRGVRYAVYIRFPEIGTVINSTRQPNLDHAMVRVSWGSDVNDPRTSRIFMLDFSQTGGFWLRVRKDDTDDRYFPYDGTNPIRVTLYNLTPDDVTDTTEYPAAPIVPADAVRLVPESLRGDIHGGSASARFDRETGTGDPIQLTVFGRDETVGPVQLVPNDALLATMKTQYAAKQYAPVTPFTSVPFDPTKDVNTDSNSTSFNPTIPDPTTSIRTPVFYCLEDDTTLNRYGALRWRFSANYTPVYTTAGATTAALPAKTVLADTLSANGFDAAITPVAADQAMGPYRTVTMVAYGTATLAKHVWTSELPVKGFLYTTDASVAPAPVYTGQTYTVMVWIPALSDTSVSLGRYAHYQITTAYGVSDVYLDQQTVISTRSRVGMWRVLATGVRFPFNAAGNQVGEVALLNDGPQDTNTDRNDVGQAHKVVADAIQFVPEAIAPGEVKCSPAIAKARVSSGTAVTATRDTVFVATDESSGGHVWALDPRGTYAIGATPTGTLTTAFWAYPSVSNPTAGLAAISGVYQDPNYGQAPNSTAIDGEWQAVANTSPVQYTTVRPATTLEGFRSSPVYVESTTGSSRDAFKSYLFLGNQNGRLYGLDPTGRGDSVAASGDTPGTPGTSQRLLTWPTVGRDRWVRDSGTPSVFDQYADDASKTSIAAPVSTDPSDSYGLATMLVFGAGDGHVYALDPTKIDTSRIYNRQSVRDYGKPLWQYPKSTTSLDAITYPGVFTSSNKYVFSAGGRVYAVSTNDRDAISGSEVAPTARLRWAYPFTSDTASDLAYTAPMWRASVSGLNSGNEVVFAANLDGTVVALDSSPDAATPTQVTPLWTFDSISALRSSPTYLTMLPSNFTPAGTSGEGILLPLDDGSLAGIYAVTGTLTWQYYDGDIGAVPATDSSGNVYAANTGNVYRGAEAAVANRFAYEGDEGDQDTGEIHGQFHAYADTALVGSGGYTPGESGAAGAGRNGLFDIRGLNVFTKANYDTIVNTGFTAYDPPAPGPIGDAASGLHLVLYEWGDQIYAVAWGATADGETMPSTVDFRLTGRGANRRISTAPKLNGSTIAMTLTGVDGTSTVTGKLWIANATISLGLPSQRDPQSPGSRYRLYARVRNSQGARSFELGAGQTAQSNGTVSDVTTRRNLSIAHPLALSTAGSPTNGIGGSNIIGWTPYALTSNAYRELLGNGNRIVNVDAAGNVTTATQKDLFAPIGAVTDGGSATYLGINSAGTRVAALYVVDRSNLHLLNERLKNVRIDRNDLAWGWNTNNTAQQATGNVMNPLPWETFPNTVPNVSPDYPDVDRTHVAMRANGVNMAAAGATLPPASGQDAAKTFSPVAAELQVDVPKYQPANVNDVYFDINGNGFQNVYSPMVVGGTGGTPATGGVMVFPSCGYVGTIRVYVGVGGRDTMDARFANRQMKVGIGVPPNIQIRTEEETIDLGKAPHALGYTPSLPFAPSGIGPYSTAPYNGVSPYDVTGLPSFFAPFTVKSDSNVNLVDVRVAKIIGNQGTDPRNPAYWSAMTSESVDSLTGVGRIWGVPYNLLGGSAVGNLGIVSSLDHARTPTPQFEIDYQTRYGRPNFWPQSNPYVVSGNAVGWNASEQPRPTLHKPRPNDASPTVMSVPDVAYGDPAAALSANVDNRPKIGVAVPMSTPSGTYSNSIYVFEDHYPEQWRSWMNQYKSLNNVSSAPMDAAQDDDGILNVAPGGATPVEGVVKDPFRLKITVKESRLTNGFTAGAYPQIDVLGTNQGTLGANMQPAIWRDPTSANGGLLLYWTTNRQPLASPPTGGDSWVAPMIQNTPWLLTHTRLGAVIGSVNPYGNVFDWQFADTSRWWSRPATPFPATDTITLDTLFPSERTGASNVPPVPGVVVPATVRHGSPAMTQNPTTGDVWLFWQGAAYKNTGNTGTGAALDARTFWMQVDPRTGDTLGQPFSFLNDPALPKYGPKPFMASANGKVYSYLFWYGGSQGRTRLYYNRNTSGNLSTQNAWSSDAALPTPGALQWQSDPIPVGRAVYDDTGAQTNAIDLVYTGELRNRRQPETILTRYRVANDGSLSVMRLPRVKREVLARDGILQTWTSRNLSWVYLFQGTYVDASTPDQGIVISITRADGSTISPVNQGRPTFDSATNRMYYQSALGGQLYVDPQAGSVSFPDVAPRSDDAVIAAYTPQSLRLNVTRNDVAHSDPVGSNTSPVAFLDRMQNPRRDVIYPALASGDTAPAVTRFWLLYRKTGANVTASGALYYKTMRLMVRLPHGVLRDVLSDGSYSPLPNVTITGNRGPVEIDWIRGRLYFTEADEGNAVTVAFNYARDSSGNVSSVPAASYTVQWMDEISTAVTPADQTTNEVFLPTDAAVNEGQVTAIKDPFEDKVWVFWSTTRDGSSDLYYMTLCPRFYAEPGS